MKHRPLQLKVVKETIGDRRARSRSRQWLKRITWGLAIYTVFGFLILPPIIRVVAAKQVAKELNREVSLEKVRLNPFALSLTLRGLKVTDPDTETLLAWDEVHVNFQLSSLFSRAWKFREIAVINPYARVQVNQDRSLNFSDILAAHARTNAPTEKSAAPARPLALRIGQLRVEGARVSVADLTTKTPFRRIIGPVKISITDFRTEPNNRNPHIFTGSTETGETFTWGGHFSTDPLSAVGELGVENVTLNKLAPLYQDFVNFEIRDGVAGFHANYEFRLGQATNIAAVSNVSFTLRSFKLGTADVTENLVELPEFSVAGVRGDLLTRKVEVDSVAVREANFHLIREPGAPFNIVTAAQPNTNQPAPGGLMLLMSSVTNAFVQLLHSTNLASATVREVTVQDCAFTLRDKSPDHPVSLRVDQINISAKNLSNRPETNMLASVSLRWNTNGSLKIDLDAALDPLNADLSLRLDRIELAPLSPYLRPFMRLSAVGSKAGLDGVVRLRTEPGALPSVTFTGDIVLDDLNLVTDETGEDLLKWSSLRFDGIAANLNPPAVTVTNITLKDLAAQVAIETNGAINLTSVVRTGGPGPSGVGTGAAAAAPTETGSSAIKRAFAQVKSLLGMETNAAAASLPRVEIGTVTVDNAELHFSDRSVTPPVRTAVTKINATIQRLSTEEMRRAQVHLTALAGGTGPIEINGQLNPFRAKQATEAKVTLKNVKLNPADPYAAKFLGYRLTRGELNVDVEYTISASQLKGRNVIVLDQLTLGSKVASTNATSLPVKLGLALLKDSSGKIEIDVPVEGNLDDPQFRLGKVIWHMVGNIFLKAVTSPFSLLGSLAGGRGGEEMQFQEFAPGAAELDATAREKLMTIAKALAARPELQVEVEGNVQPDLDGEALRRAKLELQLRTARWSSLRASARTNTTPAQLTLAPEDRSALLAKAYRDALKSNPQFAAVPATIPPTSAPPQITTPTPARPRAVMEKGATRLLKPGSTTAGSAGLAGTAPAGLADGRLTEEQMTRALMAALKLTDEDFAVLATRRAGQVQACLVQELKVAADRVFVSQGTAASYATNGHRVNLQLR